MKTKVFIKNNLKLHPKDSVFNIGIDVKAALINIVGEKHGDYYLSIDYIEYDTLIFLDSLKRNEEQQIYTLVYPRSSISTKNLILCNSVGVIDPNYRDSIKLRFKYLNQPKDLISHGLSSMIKIDESKIYKINDKIGQIIFSRSLDISTEYVSELMPSDRSGGFGSTGE
jgi:dUTPase